MGIGTVFKTVCSLPKGVIRVRVLLPVQLLIKKYVIMYVSGEKTLEELLKRENSSKVYLDELKIGTAVVCLAPTETEYGIYAVYLKCTQDGYAYSGLFNKLDDAMIYAKKLSNMEAEGQGECSSATSDCLYCHSVLESSSPSTSGTIEWGNLTVPTYFTSFVNNKVSFMLNMKDADELFRTLSVLINSGYKITLMSGSGENGYVLTYSPSDLTCSIVG